MEDHALAPYAMRSVRSLGRLYTEARHDYRTAFQRDRDRVLHSRCFRRLEYKTQVFQNGTADHYRTRLTHTMEMAAVGRTIARALGANEDLTEAIALAHDIGHSPFGHCGEDALDELMKNEGGFDHNEQSCRWVEYLETQYPDFPGLNLSWEVRAGLRKHQADIPGAEIQGHPIGPFQFLEAQIADAADDITYQAHDVDDGLEAGLLTEEQLRTTELWRRATDRVKRDYPHLAESQRRSLVIRALLDMQVEDLLHHSQELLAEYHPANPAAVMNAPGRIIAFLPEMAGILSAFKAFLYRNFYFHPAISGAHQEAVRWMRQLFLYYVEHPEIMGRKAQARIPRDGVWRAACDYISGMTDRYALDEHHRFIGSNAEEAGGPP